MGVGCVNFAPLRGDSNSLFGPIGKREALSHRQRRRDALGEYVRHGFLHGFGLIEPFCRSLHLGDNDDTVLVYPDTAAGLEAANRLRDRMNTAALPQAQD